MDINTDGSATSANLNMQKPLNSVSIFLGKIKTTDSTTNKATVNNQVENINQDITLDLPTFCSPTGVGMRFTPFPDTGDGNSIRILDNQREFIGLHYLNVPSKYVDNKNATAEQIDLPLRYLLPGEVSIASGQGSELFFDTSGSATLSSSNYDSIVINGLTSTTTITSANFKSEFDGVRVRAGNIIRPVDPESLDEYYLIKDTAIQEKEFMVEVGTTIGVDGVDSDKPSVGIMALGTRIFDEQGRFYKSTENNLQYLVKTTAGGGIGIDDTGATCVFDYNNGNTVVLGGGDSPDKWIRVGSNSLSITESAGMGLISSTGAAMEISPEGDILMQEAGGNSIGISQQGIMMSAAQSSLTIMSKSTLIHGPVAFGAFATYSVLRAENVVSQFDIHVHPGPGAPPAVPWSTLLWALLAASDISIS